LRHRIADLTVHLGHALLHSRRQLAANEEFWITQLPY
jgi:hypothetical protein